MSRPWRQWCVLRVAPHIVDTVLLGSALWLAWRIGQYPFVNGWLTAKTLGLLAYILLGMRALGKNTRQSQRLPFFVAALLMVGYIVGVALTHSPSWGLLQNLSGPDLEHLIVPGMVEQDALHTLLPQASKFSALFVVGLTREAKLHQAHGLGVASYAFRIRLGQHGLAGIGASEAKLGLDVDAELQQTASHKRPPIPAKPPPLAAPVSKPSTLPTTPAVPAPSASRRHTLICPRVGISSPYKALMARTPSQ